MTDLAQTYREIVERHFADREAECQSLCDAINANRFDAKSMIRLMRADAEYEVVENILAEFTAAEQKAKERDDG